MVGTERSAAARIVFTSERKRSLARWSYANPGLLVTTGRAHLVRHRPGADSLAKSGSPSSEQKNLSHGP